MIIDRVTVFSTTDEFQATCVRDWLNTKVSSLRFEIARAQDLYDVRLAPMGFADLLLWTEEIEHRMRDLAHGYARLSGERICSPKKRRTR